MGIFVQTLLVLLFSVFPSGATHSQYTESQQCIYSCEIKKAGPNICTDSSGFYVVCAVNNSAQSTTMNKQCSSFLQPNYFTVVINMNDFSSCTVTLNECTINHDNAVQINAHITVKSQSQSSFCGRNNFNSANFRFNLTPNECEDEIICDVLLENTSKISTNSNIYKSSFTLGTTPLTASTTTENVPVIISAQSVTTSSNFPSITSAHNETPSDKSKQTNKDNSDLTIGLVSAFVAVFITLLIVFLLIWWRRRTTKALSSVPDRKQHLPSQPTEKNYSQNDSRRLNNTTESKTNVYDHINKNEEEAHPYCQISDSDVDVIPKNCPNLYSVMSDVVNGEHDAQRASSLEPSDSSACAGAYFVLESEGTTQDYGSTGNYFTLEKENDASYPMSTISNADAKVISPPGYSKLGEIKRETTNAYGVAEETDSNVNLPPMHMNTITTPAPPENAAVYSLAGNATNNSSVDLPDKTDMPYKHTETSDSYSELENGYFEFKTKYNDERDN